MDVTHVGWPVATDQCELPSKGSPCRTATGRIAGIALWCRYHSCEWRLGGLWALTLHPWCFWVLALPWTLDGSGVSSSSQLGFNLHSYSQWEPLSQAPPVSICSIYTSATQPNEFHLDPCSSHVLSNL